MLKKLHAKDTEKGEMFENKHLEGFTKTRPWQAITFYGLLYAFFIFLNHAYSGLNFWKSLVVYLFALVFWSLFEYLAHRFLFHFENEKPWVQKFHYLIHGIHHEYPRDAERLIMPPLPGAFITGFLFALFYLLMGKLAFIFTAGFINGWAIYVSIHYIVHAFQPVKGFKILWTHHAKHHYKQGNKAFGVSSPFWDRVFGTMPN